MTASVDQSSRGFSFMRKKKKNEALPSKVSSSQACPSSSDVSPNHRILFNRDPHYLDNLIDYVVSMNYPSHSGRRESLDSKSSNATMSTVSTSYSSSSRSSSPSFSFNHTYVCQRFQPLCLSTKFFRLRM